MITNTYLSLGSNLGDKKYNIFKAIEDMKYLSINCKKIIVSHLYEADPLHFDTQPTFINAVCCLWTELNPFELLNELTKIQKISGKNNAFINGPRKLDIDIILYGKHVIETPNLIIPHPRMLHREFVLKPLVEIAPETRHPILNETMESLLEKITQNDGNTVKIEPFRHN